MSMVYILLLLMDDDALEDLDMIVEEDCDETLLVDVDTTFDVV